MALSTNEFSPSRITNLNVKFRNDAEGSALKFGCAGQVEGETEIQTKVKNCEGVQVAQKSTVTKINLTVTAHVNIDVFRRILGLTNDALKPGIYAYGSNSKFESFSLVADVIDEFGDVTKLIAFPNCSSNTGLVFSIENGADEVAELEMEFSAMQDEQKNCYYEAFVDELEDPAVADEWRTNFSYDTVKEVTP